MLFPTVTFAVFFLAVLPLSWLLMRAQRPWAVFMISASYVFYAWWNWHYVFLLAGSTVLNHAAAQAIYRTKATGVRKGILAATVSANLGLLAYFKYAGFLVSSGENTLAALGIAGPTSVITPLLPVGISFFTFMALS